MARLPPGRAAQGPHCRRPAASSQCSPAHFHPFADDRAKLNASAWLGAFKTEVQPWGASDVVAVHNDSTSADGVVLAAGDNLYVIFRGTEDGGDVATDVNFVPANCEHKEVAVRALVSWHGVCESGCWPGG